MKIKVSENLKKLAGALGGDLYIVGGTVRNAMLKLPQGDVDIAGSKLPSEVKELATACGFDVIDDYASFGTLLIKRGKESFEYTTFRTDSYKNAHRPIEVEFTKDIAVDAKRRDFTANAVYYKVSSRELVDPLGGTTDIEKKLLRSANGEKTFEEDGLRLLRLVRFSGELGFSIETSTFNYAKAHAGKIKDIAPERIMQELEKILLCDIKYGELCIERVFNALKTLDNLGVLDYIFPKLTLGRGMAQNAEHHKYDVLDHCLWAAAYAKPEIRLYALLHDIGKPECFLKNGNFYEHAEIGADIVCEELTRLRCKKSVIERAVRLTHEHMKDLCGDMRENKLRKYFVKNADILDDLISLKIADGYASGMDDGYSVTVRRWAELLADMKADGLPFSVAGLKITGGDVIAITGKENAKYTSLILQNLLDKVVTKEIRNTKTDLSKNVERAFKEVKNG